jgi:glycosyltransferase involved in cell wall biosynthesis
MPAYNEAGHLQAWIPEVIECLGQLGLPLELVLVNDGSSDHTSDILKSLAEQYPQVLALDLTRNFGKESALSAGMDAASGDLILIMDADGQHPLSLVPEMLKHWREGAEVVYGVRSHRHDQSWAYIRFTSIFYKLINWGSRFEIPANAGDFRLMDKKVADAIKLLPERNRFMKGLYAWVGFRSVAIEYQPLPRLQGESRYGLRGGFQLALTGMLAFSITPLRFLALGGVALSLAALCYGAWVIGDYFINGISVPGYATIVVALMFFSGIQMLGLGILAEYVGRIYEEVKQRPRYLVRQIHGRGLR